MKTITTINTIIETIITNNAIHADLKPTALEQEPKQDKHIL